MNELQYQKYINLYGEKFVKSFEKEVLPDACVKFDQVARVKGDLQENINRYAGAFAQGEPQRVPCSAKPYGVSGKHYEIKDGTTRGEAKNQAYRTDTTQRTLISTFQHDHLGFTDNDWEDFQDNSNDHLGGQPTTERDMLKAIGRRIKNTRLNDIVEVANGGVALDPTNAAEFEDYCKVAGQWFRDNLWPNSGRTPKYFSNKVENLLTKAGQVPDTITTWGPQKIQKNYADLGGTGFVPSDKARFKGINPNGEKVVAAKNNNQMVSNIYGALLNHEVRERTNDFTVILSYDRAFTKEASDIARDRNSFVTEIKKAIKVLDPSFVVRVKTTEQIDSDSAGFTTIYKSVVSPAKKKKKASSTTSTTTNGTSPTAAVN
jgi:hypothetical protein